MKPMLPAKAVHSVFLALAGGLLLPLAGSLPAAELDPERVRYSAVQLSGSRLFVSVDAEIRLQRRPALVVADSLLPVASGQPVKPGSEVMELTYRTRAAGRRSEIVLLMDPWSGAALQRFQDDFQGRLRQRTYRFGTQGAWLLTRRPAEGEDGMAPQDWSDVEEGFRPFPADALGELVSEPSGLFYLIAASPLAAPGDQASFLVYSRRNLHRVTVVVTEPRRIAIDLDRLRAGQRSRQRDNLRAPRLLISGETLGDPDEDDEFELLGLRGELELYLDPESRAPLQLSGNVRMLGRITLRTRLIEAN